MLMTPFPHVGRGGQLLFLPSHTDVAAMSAAVVPAVMVQAVPAGFFASVDGHVAAPPEQNSALSHWPAAGRQMVVLPANLLVAGHESDEPLHVSAISQIPAAARQMVPAG